MEISYSWRIIILGFFSLLLFIPIVMFIIILIKGGKKQLKIKAYNIKRKLCIFKNKTFLIKRIAKNIYKGKQSCSVSMLFELFVDFYDKHVEEFDSWGWDLKSFPDGKISMVQMYKWIQKIRIDNQEEFKHLCLKDDKVDYWGSHFSGFRFKIDSKGELEIKPIDVPMDFHFNIEMVKLQNALYNLDTEKANWIIERRRFLGI